MAVMAGVLDETQRKTLEALCDTYVPSVATDSQDPVERDFLARAATDMGIPAQIEGMMAQQMTPDEIAGVAGLLGVLAQQDFAALPLEGRTRMVQGTMAADPAAALGLQQLRGLTMLLFYALPDEHGHNPNWEALGYPGPVSTPPSAEQAPKTIELAEVPSGGGALSADAVVVGSGAGGAVIAAQLAAAGKQVLVLEMGGYSNEQDFAQLEMKGMSELYYGGGLAASEDGSIAVLAGSTLGGGTVVNYMNCIRTPEAIRKEWAEHGLEGLDDPAYDERIDVVWERLGANAEATQQNNTHRKMIKGLDELGMEHRPITRNASPDDDSTYCGFCSTGCQHGCKRSAMKTWLQDASDSGARALVGCHADAITVEDGAATGVDCTVSRADGSTDSLRVDAPTVVVACGSVESPALLLRSGIGGPAVGKHLRLHPAYAVMGTYDERIEGWNGQIQSALSDHFKDLEGEYGFLIEATGLFPGLWAASEPWADGEAHKGEMMKFAWKAPFITVARDHGSGEVVLDGLGRAVVRWGLDDGLDEKLARRANVELCRLHQAAGAREVYTLHTDAQRWTQGEDPEAFLVEVEAAGYGAADINCFTAHQMGSCRMGSDPSDSVADGRGELHDTQGVWIGDASAFPTAPGVNPMVSIMALAHRTADQILGR